MTLKITRLNEVILFPIFKKKSNDVFQTWGCDPTWGQVEFKWGRLKWLASDNKKKNTDPNIFSVNFLFFLEFWLNTPHTLCALIRRLCICKHGSLCYHRLEKNQDRTYNFSNFHINSFHIYLEIYFRGGQSRIEQKQFSCSKIH